VAVTSYLTIKDMERARENRQFQEFLPMGAMLSRLSTNKVGLWGDRWSISVSR
jgi:hypothetical protein